MLDNTHLSQQLYLKEDSFTGVSWKFHVTIPPKGYFDKITFISLNPKNQPPSPNEYLLFCINYIYHHAKLIPLDIISWAFIRECTLKRLAMLWWKLYMWNYDINKHKMKCKGSYKLAFIPMFVFWKNQKQIYFLVFKN